MKPSSCRNVADTIEELSRHELTSPRREAVEGHLRECASCREEAETSRRAGRLLDSLRGDDFLADVGEVELRWMRTRILASVREEQASRAGRPVLVGFAVGLTATLVLVGLISLIGLAGAPLSAKPDMVAAVPAAEELSVMTVSTREGVTLKWQGNESGYTVLKSFGTAGQGKTEATFVCGTSWTDREAGRGLVVYRVLPAREHCPGVTG